MKTPVRLLILALVGGAGIAAITLKNKPVAKDGPAPAAVESAVPLPRLVDLGASKCIPCKAMKPILDDLAATYADRFQTIFIDVWENKEAGEKHGVRMIPTQIFYDAGGKELFRHEGFFSKEDILATWKELGFDMAQAEGGPCCAP